MVRLYTPQAQLENPRILTSIDFARDTSYAQYTLNLSGFSQSIKQKVMQETGLVITDTDERTGLTAHFIRTIFNDASDHAFFGYKGFEGVDYAILSPRIDSHELRLNGYSIAPTSDKKQLETCRGVIQRTIEYYRVFGLESQIFLSLQKLILKRNFLGHCELCPD